MSLTSTFRIRYYRAYSRELGITSKEFYVARLDLPTYTIPSNLYHIFFLLNPQILSAHNYFIHVF